MKTPKQVEPSTTKKINPTLKSTIISNDVKDIVDAYLKLKNAFINSDTFDIKQKTLFADIGFLYVKAKS